MLRPYPSLTFWRSMASSCSVYYEADTGARRLRDRVFTSSDMAVRDMPTRKTCATRAAGHRRPRPGGASWKAGLADGLEVVPWPKAARPANVIMMLVPIRSKRAVYETAVAPALWCR